jgi:hypothetical protein
MELAGLLHALHLVLRSIKHQCKQCKLYIVLVHIGIYRSGDFVSFRVTFFSCSEKQMEILSLQTMC